MNLPLPKETFYTANDYFSWQEAPPCELIDGVIYNMAPAPTLLHQDLVFNFAIWLREKLSKKDGENPPTCKVFLAPVDVKLSENTVVQPDIAVVCDMQKLDSGKYIDGAPDLIVEVLSPSTALKDRREKRELYEKAGVKEYLLVNPIEQTLEYYFLNEENRYLASQVFGPEDVLKLILFPEIEENLHFLIR